MTNIVSARNTRSIGRAWHFPKLHPKELAPPRLINSSPSPEREDVNKFLGRNLQRGAVRRSWAQSGAARISPVRVAPKNRCYSPHMPVNTTHPDYDFGLPGWLRARDVLAGEDAVKSAGEKYLPRLDSQSDEEFMAYRKRASFFNATARSAEGFIGLIFRRPPFVKVPESQSGVGRALAGFLNDSDMLGTTLPGYTKNVVSEVVGIGRAGSLID